MFISSTNCLFHPPENQDELLLIALKKEYENPKLDTLANILHDRFVVPNSQGIIFTKTRQSAHALYGWIKNCEQLKGPDIRAKCLTGAGVSSLTKHMTQVSWKIPFSQCSWFNLLLMLSLDKQWGVQRVVIHNINDSMITGDILTWQNTRSILSPAQTFVEQASIIPLDLPGQHHWWSRESNGSWIH